MIETAVMGLHKVWLESRPVADGEWFHVLYFEDLETHQRFGCNCSLYELSAIRDMIDRTMSAAAPSASQLHARAEEVDHAA